MVTVKEALEMALSERLNKSEQDFYDKVVNQIDNEIRNNFDGKSVTIRVDGFSNSNGNVVFLKDAVNKSWRQNIVTEKWKKAYSDAGWKIEIEQFQDSYARTCTRAKFSADQAFKRDEKISAILDK